MLINTKQLFFARRAQVFFYAAFFIRLNLKILRILLEHRITLDVHFFHLDCSLFNGFSASPLKACNVVSCCLAMSVIHLSFFMQEIPLLLMLLMMINMTIPAIIPHLSHVLTLIFCRLFILLSFTHSRSSCLPIFS